VAFCFLLSAGQQLAYGQQGRSAHRTESMGAQPIDNWEPIGPFRPDSNFRSAATPVGQILVEFSPGEIKPVCTGLVISPTLVLTARHCLEIKDEETQIPQIFIPKSIFLYLDHLNEGFGTRVPLNVEPVEVGQGDMDYILLSSIDAISLSDRRVPIAGDDPQPRDVLYIIHHPFAQPLKISRQSCQATDDPIDHDYFHHVCDTDEGSSGAPVLDSDLRIIGIHIAGGKSQRPGTFNSGLLLSKIMAVSPTVTAAIRTYGSNLTLVSKGTNTQTVVKYSLASGQTFTQNEDGWTLSPSPVGTKEIIRLKAQLAGNEEYILWDPGSDLLYRIPKGGGVVKRKHGGEQAWSVIGVAKK
jgi:hypothetical protein